MILTFAIFLAPLREMLGAGTRAGSLFSRNYFSKKNSKKIMSIDITLVWYFVFSYIFGVATGMLGLFWIMFFLVEGGSKIIIEKEGP